MQVLESKVNTFLDSIGRNSKNSRKAYQTALVHFSEFLKSRNQTPDTIISALQNQQANVYELLDQYLSYITKTTISTSTIKLYIAAVRSYLEYSDIDISISKFKRRVKMPKHVREDEEPIDIHDVRNILLKCNNRRLKAYLLVLASSALRPTEACALRIRDADFTIIPTKVHVRKEYSKTRRARDVYISQEATNYLQDLLNWKYRNGKQQRQPDDLIFSIFFKQNANPQMIYVRLIYEFEKLLAVAGMDQRKDNSQRRKISLHSFRRYVKGVVSDQAGQDYSEWFLGHSGKSVYWTKKEPERRKIYLQKCIPHLTILDYTELDTRSKNTEIAVKEMRQENVELKKEVNRMRDEWHALLSEPDKFFQMLQEGKNRK